MQPDLGLFLHTIDCDVRSPSCLPRAESKQQIKRRGQLACGERAAWQKGNLDNRWLALLPWKRQHKESPLAETIKVNKNWKVIAYLLFPQLDTFPAQAQSIWRLFRLTTESFYLFNSLRANWQADHDQAAGADSWRYGLLGFLLFVFHLSTLQCYQLRAKFIMGAFLWKKSTQRFSLAMWLFFSYSVLKCFTKLKITARSKTGMKYWNLF